MDGVRVWVQCEWWVQGLGLGVCIVDYAFGVRNTKWISVEILKLG